MTGSPGALRPALSLAVFVVLLGGLLAGPAWLAAGASGVTGLALAGVICLVPGWLVFLLPSGYGLPNLQVGAVLAGMVLRMLFVLGGVVAVLTARPDLRFREFIVWLLIFYLATLAFETALLLRGRAQPRR